MLSVYTKANSEEKEFKTTQISKEEIKNLQSSIFIKQKEGLLIIEKDTDLEECISIATLETMEYSTNLYITKEKVEDLTKIIPKESIYYKKELKCGNLHILQKVLKSLN